MRVALTLALATALLVAGCSLGGEDGASIEERELPQLVLQPADLPNVFVQFDGGRQGTADSPGGSRSAPDRFGRIDGWKARYRRPGTARTPGPLVIESRADLFDADDGAKDELAAIEDSLGYERLDDPSVGDEARALRTRAPSAGSAVTYFLIAWREDNVTSTLLVSGFSGRLQLAQVLELARKQQRRMAAAAA